MLGPGINSGPSADGMEKYMPGTEPVTNSRALMDSMAALTGLSVAHGIISLNASPHY